MARKGHEAEKSFRYGALVLAFRVRDFSTPLRNKSGATVELTSWVVPGTAFKTGGHRRFAFVDAPARASYARLNQA